jgi:hypothetical protein
MSSSRLSTLIVARRRLATTSVLAISLVLGACAGSPTAPAAHSIDMQEPTRRISPPEVPSTGDVNSLQGNALRVSGSF